MSDVIAAAYSRLAAVADVVVVEGAGGALVPLSPSTDMLDIPARLELPVLLVVGIRLGCLNHALLSALAIRARGLDLAGWVANRIDPDMREGDANVSVLTERLPAPLCADFAWRDDARSAFAFGRADALHARFRHAALERRAAQTQKVGIAYPLLPPARLGRGIGPC